MTRLGLILVACVMAGGALANVADGTVRPQARPDTLSLPVTIGQGLGHSLRPLVRPDRIAMAAKEKARQRAKGAVCGDTELQGVVVGRVPGKIAGCGLDNAIRLRSVSGVALSQEAVMDCTTAKALKTWVDRGVKPAIGNRGGGVAALRVAAHYSCRTRNNRPGAKISEHGKGRAIDISGLTLRNGETITVLNDWGRGATGKALRQMHKVACGPFGTVLGPGSDGYHEDHFHFDTARYRSGSYCR